MMSCIGLVLSKLLFTKNEQRLWSCRITFPVRSGKGKKRKDADGEDEDTEEAKTLIVEPHVIPNRGPYPYNQPKRYFHYLC